MFEHIKSTCKPSANFYHHIPLHFNSWGVSMISNLISVLYISRMGWEKQSVHLRWVLVLVLLFQSLHSAMCSLSWLIYKQKLTDNLQKLLCLCCIFIIPVCFYWYHFMTWRNPYLSSYYYNNCCLQNMWDLTPQTELLQELPPEYSTESALVDLIVSFLVWLLYLLISCWLQ